MNALDPHRAPATGDPLPGADSVAAVSSAAHGGPTSWEDVQAMPADGKRYESYGGVLTVTPAPSRRHQETVGALFFLLHAAAPSEVLVLTGPFDWWISETEWYEPDLVVFARAAPGERRLEVPPLLAVEVASPSTRLHDLNAKKAAYALNGCPNYWVVDPHAPSVVAFGLRSGGYEELLRAAGDERFEAVEPFPVSFTPASLLER